MPTIDDPDERRRSIGARRNPETAEAILLAAEAILSESGIAGFSIEAVAKRARAGKPTIYKWWPGRIALLLDVYERLKPPNTWVDTGSVEGDILGFLNNILLHWADSGAGQVFRFIVAEAQRDADAAQALRGYADGRRQHAGAIFARGIERGELDADIDVEAAGDLVIGYIWLRLLTQRLERDPTELAQVARQMVRGLTAPGP